MDKEKQLELLKSDLIIAQNKLNDIQKNFIALSDELEKEKKSVWKPHQKGFFITGDSNEIGIFDNKNNTNLHNCFRTREVAKLRQKQKLAEDELFNIWESLVGDWRPSWSTTQTIFRINYNFKEKTTNVIGNNIMVEVPLYYYFPNTQLPKIFYELASEHAKAFIRGEF